MSDPFHLLQSLANSLADVAVPNAPGGGQVAALAVAIALFAAGGIASIVRSVQTRRHRDEDSRSLNRLAKSCLVAGIVTAAAVLVWHAAHRDSWIPLDDNFDAFTWIAVLLAAFIAYDQRRRSVGGLDWFVMPIVVLLLAAAIAFGSARPHRYAANTWNWVHVVAAYGGTVAFAVAAASGATYLVANRRLRVKTAPAMPATFGSLERLEHLTISSASIGFALLTLATILGFVKMISDNRSAPVTKIALTTAVWLTYAAVLHAPINPSFRGRKTAILSIAGFVFMAAVLVAVQILPARR